MLKNNELEITEENERERYCAACNDILRGSCLVCVDCLTKDCDNFDKAASKRKKSKK